MWVEKMQLTRGQKGTALLMATENITVKGANFNIKGDAVLQAVIN